MTTLHNEETLAFVRLHREDDVRRLALAGDKYPTVDMPWALAQISGWQTARHKLPSWACQADVVYPPHLNMEQCSSEQTARYKASLAASLIGAHRASDSRLVDLTGGFGVDFSWMARGFAQAVYVERNESLCQIARHNFQVLGLSHAEVVVGDAATYLQTMPPVAIRPTCCSADAVSSELASEVADVVSSETGSSSAIAAAPLSGSSSNRPATLIYLDPARRDANGHKVFGLEDCTPDVVSLCDALLERADAVMVKVSPMLDWHEAVRRLKNVSEVHIVSVANECKELLLVMAHTGQPLRVCCVNDSQTFCFTPADAPLSSSPSVAPSSCPLASSSSSPSASPSSGPSVAPQEKSYLLVPNSSVMKAGCFRQLEAAYGVPQLGIDAHLFVSSCPLADFPGRQFRILRTTSMNKRELRRAFEGITQANIAVRHFPLTADALRRRLKLKDGGDIYVFATTIGKDHCLLITEKHKSTI